eukprot:TRINITY_DN4478_c0_g1_i1.p1 TRINITY_DN4478_c0_g1~~TRINITY_DN4478_c0_g1_i1.p1  ORF type:complete len:121 (+),score=26.64 TRINITY_DN4478_c0_g1_i1:116-478(+)
MRRTPGASWPKTTPSPPPMGFIDAQEELFVEDETEKKMGFLAEKIFRIKTISEIMETEIKDHNRLLEEMESGMTSTENLMSSAWKGMKRLVNPSSSRHMSYLYIFVVFVFIFIYFLLKFR